MKADLNQTAELVVDEASFLRFLKALADDWNDEEAKERGQPSHPYGPGANGWENGTIGNFLEAAAAWANASPAEASRIVETAAGTVWQRVAQILLAGKFYE
ncbi:MULTISPECIES: hypothetical protein [Rhodomicrobium]|uniref:DUF7660 family protein n=1 Tax=Rhodomicrobium TaxID=1068 RepID=UPI000B4A871C|nr:MULTISPECIES: hypothetical protein [Rhodomicrobium]